MSAKSRRWLCNRPEAPLGVLVPPEVVRHGKCHSAARSFKIGILVPYAI
jgi:hypothetical protein